MIYVNGWSQVSNRCEVKVQGRKSSVKFYVQMWLGGVTLNSWVS